MRTKIFSFIVLVVVMVFSSNAFSLPTHLRNVVDFEHNKIKKHTFDDQCNTVKNAGREDEMSRLVMQMSLTDDRGLRGELSKQYQLLAGQ